VSESPYKLCFISSFSLG